jgi:hypothetical protein
MANQIGTLQGCECVLKGNSGFGSSGAPAREMWRLTYSWPAYTGASDTAQVSGVVAAINAKARDGKTRTLRGGFPGPAGYDTAAQAVYMTGTAAQVLTVSTNDLTGQLSDNTGAELATTTVVNGVSVLVFVDVNIL